MALPELKMQLCYSPDPDYPHIDFCLWDTTHQCILDKWLIEGHQEIMEMEKDINSLGVRLPETFGHRFYEQPAGWQ